MDFAAARQSACRGPGPVLPHVSPSRASARVCGALWKSERYISSTYVNVIAHVCVPAYKHTLIHIKETASPEYFSRKVKVMWSEDGCSLGATRWFGSEKSATVETEESTVPRRGGGQQGPIPSLGLV